MDFGKIRKIFYIVAIISMLLSIKSKVFGAAYFYTVNRGDATDTVDVSHFTDDLSNYKIFFSARYLNTLGGHRRYSAFFVCSDEEFIINDSDISKGIVTFSQNQKYYYTTSIGINDLSNLQSFIDNINPTLRTSSYHTLNFPYDDYANTTKETSDFYANFNILNQNGDIYASNNAVINPFFANPEELEDAPENVFIELGDYSANDYLYFHLLEVTNIMPMSNNDSTYYYNDHAFALNKDSKYYTQLLDTTKYYYAIPRSALGLNPNTSYFYVLTNSSTQIDNSINPITEGDGIYDVIMQDTTGIITEDMATNDKLQNINQEFRDYQQQQEEFQNQNSILPETEIDIDNNLNFNNQNNSLNALNNGFFSRLTSMLSNLSGYNLSEDTSVSIPLPNSNKNIVLHSIDIHNNITGALRLIINAFWVYIFTFYLWKFINKIYIAVSSGNILDTFSSSGEVITNDML